MMWQARVNAICDRAHGTGSTSATATSVLSVADTSYPRLTSGIRSPLDRRDRHRFRRIPESDVSQTSVTRETCGQHRPDRVTLWGLVGDLDELELLVVTGDDAFGHLTDARGVVLLLGLRLVRTAFAGDEQLREAAVRHGRTPVQAQHPGLVERLAGRVVLLPIGVSGLRVGRHDDARFRTFDTGLPGVARPGHMPVFAL